MTLPLRARYGAKDDMHALLEWDGHPGRLPGDLLGLTDKPPGSYGPGDRWWPSVGCGPVGEWWALWWTRPDEQARRGGMVLSEVALWRLEEVGTVDDLRPLLESLGGGAPIAIPSDELLGAVVDALLAQHPRQPIVLDLDLWPGILAALWLRFWPAVRQMFSARVAISPPQSDESVNPPWIFGVPPERAPQWWQHPRIFAAPGTPQFSRATRWLVGDDDPIFAVMLAACPSLPANLGYLGQVARAADRLDVLREQPDPQRALNLLRTLIALAPGPDDAIVLKTEALTILAHGLADAPANIVLSLTNLDLAHLPSGVALESAIGAWTSRWVPELPIAEALQLLNRLSPDQAYPWWQQAVGASVLGGLIHAEPRWSKVALRWLGQPNADVALQALLPATGAVEQCILDVAFNTEMDVPALQQIRRQAVKRKWSRLHAWAVMEAQPPSEALRIQRTFPGDPLAGLVLLVERLPGSAVVNEAISNPDLQVTALVARRTAREPELMGPLDAALPAWRALWTAHVTAGGMPWPPGANRQVLGQRLLDAVIAGDEPDRLISALAEGLADTAVDHPRRSALWITLSVGGRDALLRHVADTVLKGCENGRIFPAMERPLGDAVASKARRSRISARVFAALLSWDILLDEQEAIRWMGSPGNSEWVPVAETVGRAVLARRWVRAAEELYKRCGYTPELRVAAEACQELLSSFQRWRLSWAGKPGEFGSSDSTMLAKRIAELGANLAPDRLEDLWVRAGGERRQLKSGGAPDVHWREAATLAKNGALEGGLIAIVREMLVDMPHNSELNELKRLLGDQHRY